MQRGKLNASFNLRLPVADAEKLEAVARRLYLERTEVARRALKEGLKLFADARLPGATER